MDLRYLEFEDSADTLVLLDKKGLPEHIAADVPLNEVMTIDELKKYLQDVGEMNVETVQDCTYVCSCI